MSRGLPSQIRVLLVDDYEPCRTWARSALSAREVFHIVGEAADGADAVQKAQELSPDLILLDIGLPELNGIQAAQRIRDVSPTSKILFVSDHRSREIVETALSTGASGYVVKSEAASELLIAVRAVLEGKRFVSTGVDGDYNPYLQFGRSPLIPEFLASIIDVAAADYGNVQLFDSTNHTLKIVAQHGFESEFLNHFSMVDHRNDSPCSRAMIGRSRIVVKEVGTDPHISTESRSALLRANVRSVQSTPLMDSIGAVIGVVSTHYRRPEGFTPQMWKCVDDLAAELLAKINKEATAPCC